MTLKQKGYLGMTLWIMALLGTINTNNDPNPIMARIFSPVKFAGATFYYSGLIGIVLLYIGYKLMKKNWENIYPRLTKRIGSFVILSIFILPGIFEYGIMAYKSFNNNLNGIYCYQRNKQFSIDTNQNNKIQIKCKLKLKNCTSKTQEFVLELYLPEYIKENFKESKLAAVNGETGETERFVIGPGGTAFIEAVFIGKPAFEDLQMSAKYGDFQFRLYNNEQVVQFIEKDDLYKN